MAPRRADRDWPRSTEIPAWPPQMTLSPRLRYRCPPMVTRFPPALRLLAATLLLAGCGGEETGPISVSAIGGAPRLANPNREPLDPPTAILLEAAAQGLVRFDAGGEIEPALAQRWIVSDDGLRYTFRLGKAHWRGGRITAEQVVARLRAAAAPASRNPVEARSSARSTRSSR